MHQIFLNHLSFNCSSLDEAKNYLLESLFEVLKVLGDKPKACFFHSSNSIQNLHFGNNIYYNDILHSFSSSDPDIYSVLIDLDDKSCYPVDDVDIVNYISNLKNPYIANLEHKTIEELLPIILASYTHSILLSFNSSDVWSQPLLHLHYYEDEACSNHKFVEVGNISQKGHANIWIANFGYIGSTFYLKKIGNYSIKIFSREHGKPHFHICHRNDKLVSVTIDDFHVLCGSIPNNSAVAELISWAQENMRIIRSTWNQKAQPQFQLNH